MFFSAPTASAIYTLSLHDALPIWWPRALARRGFGAWTARRSAGGAVSTSPRCTSPDRKSTRLNSSHVEISYAVFRLKKKLLQIFSDVPGGERDYTLLRVLQPHLDA